MSDKKTKSKLVRLTENQLKLIQQNPEIIPKAVQIALDLSIGCILDKKELLIIKGLDYQFHINTDDCYFVLINQNKAVKCRSFETLSITDLNKFKTFVQENPSFSDNLIYKFNSFLD